jgi:hypothetical protein
MKEPPEGGVVAGVSVASIPALLPGLPKESGRYRVPAAMAAGVVDRLWTFEELFDRVMGNGQAMAA